MMNILSLLREQGSSLCIAMRMRIPADEIIATASWGYLRLRRSNYTGSDHQNGWKESFATMGEGLRIF